MPWFAGVVFRCPCDERQVYIASPPHTISFDSEDALTVNASCGYKARAGRPSNWCHFWIKDGKASMCSDAKCPGANL